MDLVSPAPELWQGWLSEARSIDAGAGNRLAEGCLGRNAAPALGVGRNQSI
jgi:hypothetical protein